MQRIIFSRGLLNIDMPNVFKLGKGPEQGHVNCSFFIAKIPAPKL
jgi:hypothetical protein